MNIHQDASAKREIVRDAAKGDMKRVRGEFSISVEEGINDTILKTTYDTSNKIVTEIMKT